MTSNDENRFIEIYTLLHSSYENNLFNPYKFLSNENINKFYQEINSDNINHLTTVPNNLWIDNENKIDLNKIGHILTNLFNELYQIIKTNGYVIFPITYDDNYSHITIKKFSIMTRQQFDINYDDKILTNSNEKTKLNSINQEHTTADFKKILNKFNFIVTNGIQHFLQSYIKTKDNRGYDDILKINIYLDINTIIFNTFDNLDIIHPEKFKIFNFIKSLHN